MSRLRLQRKNNCSLSSEYLLTSFSATGGVPIFKDIDRQVKVELTEATPNKSTNK